MDEAGSFVERLVSVKELGSADQRRARKKVDGEIQREGAVNLDNG